MPQLIALLRAVNVGGTAKLSMADLRKLAEGLGFTDVQTYIQSGNLVFRSRAAAAGAKLNLEAALAKKLGKPCAVIVRSHEELQATEAANPFPDAESAKVLVLFLDSAPDKKVLASVKAPGGEEFAAGQREVYFYFPNGMGQSKLKIPFAEAGTGRNLNTVRALLRMSAP